MPIKTINKNSGKQTASTLDMKPGQKSLQYQFGWPNSAEDKEQLKAIESGATKIAFCHNEHGQTVGVQMFFGDKEVSFGVTDTSCYNEVVLDNPDMILVSE